MPTSEPASNPTPPPTSGPGDPIVSSAVDVSSLNYQVGFEQGHMTGYWQGRKGAWNSLLICLGNQKSKKQGLVYLESLVCLLEIEKLTPTELDAKVVQAKKNFGKWKMQPVIKNLIKNHWKG